VAPASGGGAVTGMANSEATELGQRAVRLGLISDDQLRDCTDEISPVAPPEVLIQALERKQYLTAFQSQKLIKGDTEGYFLGGYRILYKIASGSFGRVHRADDPRTGAAVAIKVLRRRWTEDPRKVDLFEREGKMGLRLQHPNIVQILAVHCDRASGQFFIVMEFVEGSNLRDLLAIRKKLDVKESIRITEEAAAGLAHAYSHGLTHRDIKPSNILLSSSGVAKLVDFGLAEIARNAGYMLTDDDTAVDRTVDYAGLERATEVKAGDVRSDIFFLGCVLYEMLTGRPALPQTRDRRARMLKSRFENIHPLTRADIEMPDSVFHLLDRMMALNPNDRFQTPAQLLDAVRAVQTEIAGGSSAAELTPQGPRTVFVVEKREKFQEVLREKFKSLGFRVLVSIDANRALQRFQQQPFHALVLDVGTVGEESLQAYREIQKEAKKKRSRCAGLILLAEEQAKLGEEIAGYPDTALLIFPLKKGELEQAMEQLLPPGAREESHA
jgi:serine/threonine protein kinase